VNKRRSEDRNEPAAGKIADAAGIALITELYACDFGRFGCHPERPESDASKPVLSAEYTAARDAECSHTSRLLHRTTTRIRRGVARRLTWPATSVLAMRQ
jgi:hypothetical protein